METTAERTVCVEVGFWRAVTAMVWKDLVAELRNKEIVSAMLVFSLLVVLIFNFALELDRYARVNVAAGVLWVILVFSSTLALNRTFATEKERNSMDGLLLAPVDRSVIYFGKLLITLIFVLLVQTVVIPVFSILFSVDLLKPMFLLVVLLGATGYVVVGTLLAAMAVHTRAREIMLPILLFPITVPIVLAAVRASEGILAGLDWRRVAGPINLIIAYDIIFLAISYMVFDYLVDE